MFFGDGGGGEKVEQRITGEGGAMAGLVGVRRTRSGVGGSPVGGWPT